ncbi:MAG: hypothetical protein ABW003_14310 [Microvirga sp.]
MIARNRSCTPSRWIIGPVERLQHSTRAAADATALDPGLESAASQAVLRVRRAIASSTGIEREVDGGMV